MAETDLFAHLYPPNKGTLFEGDRTLCQHAKAFLAWVQPLVTGATAAESAKAPKERLMALRQAKLHLLDRYFETQAGAPKGHRSRMGERGHTCLFHVFEKAYHVLRQAELALEPLPLFEPPPPPPPVLIQTPPEKLVHVPLFLGEADEKE